MATARPYRTVEEARSLPGLRVAFTHGVPGPWGQSVREILDLKGIDYIPVIQEGGSANEALREWTGQTSAPVAMYNDDRARAHWSEMLMLAEKLAPEPRLVPVDEQERMEMFGILHELCAEDGFGWSARLIVLDMIDQAGAHDVATWMRGKFASGSTLDHAAGRIRTVVAALAARLDRQQAAGSDYLVGTVLSAADIYWTTFSNMVAPIPHEHCPMPESYRAWSDMTRQASKVEVPDSLIAHRDRILQDYLRPPMWF